MVGVIELCGQEDLAPWYAGCLDPLTDPRFICILGRSVYVSVAKPESMFDGSLHYSWLGFPSS